MFNFIGDIFFLLLKAIWYKSFFKLKLNRVKSFLEGSVPKETYFSKVKVQTLIKFNGYISFSSYAIFYLPVPAAGAGHEPATLE
jgi:hypothetical protein